jgi:ankyrin repeat protein
MVNANLDMANKNGWTPIIHLSGTNSTNIVGCLLERGVSVNKSSYAGVTAPNNAADTGQLAMGKLLCKWEASLEAAYNGQTPLWSASVSGHLEVVKFLSDQGASTGATDGNGWTLLHAAARNGHFEVARFLLGRGSGSMPRPSLELQRFALPQTRVIPILRHFLFLKEPQ